MSIEFNFIQWTKQYSTTITTECTYRIRRNFFRIGYISCRSDCNGETASYSSMFLINVGVGNKPDVKASSRTACSGSIEGQLTGYGELNISVSHNIQISFNSTDITGGGAGKIDPYTKSWTRQQTPKEYLGDTVPLSASSDTYLSTSYNPNNAIFSHIIIKSNIFTFAGTLAPSISPTTAVPTSNPTTNFPSIPPTYHPIMPTTIRPTTNVQTTNMPTNNALQPTCMPTTNMLTINTYNPSIEQNLTVTAAPIFSSINPIVCLRILQFLCHQRMLLKQTIATTYTIRCYHINRYMYNEKSNKLYFNETKTTLEKMQCELVHSFQLYPLSTNSINHYNINCKQYKCR